MVPSVRATTKALAVPLWSELAILVNPATSKKAVMYHALAEQKNGDCQAD
jgi:hypothetical protein